MNLDLGRQAERLRRLARVLVTEGGAAEDLVQETWLAVLRRPNSVRRSVPGWLAGVLRHLAWRNRARERRRGTVEERAARPELVEGPEEAVARVELQERLWRAVLALAEPYRSAVILRHLDQLEPDEIARRQGCSREAARQRVSRGLEQLRQRLDGEHGGRERWCLALLPLARSSGGAGTTWGVGGILMTKWVAAVVGVLVLCAWWWGARGSDRGSTSFGSETSTAVVAPEAEPSPSASGASAREALVDPVAATSDRPQLPDERFLRGRVVDPAGAPVAGARVTLRRPELRGFASLDLALDPEGERVAEATSDGEGHFSFDLGPDRIVDVWAEKSSVGEAVANERFAGQTIELILTSAFHLQGRVTRASDGVPVAEALVRVSRSRDHGLTLRRQARTDADGRYEFHLPVGDSLRVYVEPKVEQSRYSLRPEFDANGEARLDVEILEGLAVEGTVTDAESGLPIAGAVVGESWTMGRSTRTDAAGVYRFTGFGTEGVYDLHAKAEGHASVLDYPAGSAEGGYERLDFALPRARSAYGQVVDTEGKPVADVYVAALGSGAPGQEDWCAGRTDVEGRFRCDGLDPGLRHTLLVHATGFASVYYDFPSTELATREVDLGAITLHPPGTIAGRVLDAEQQPVPGAQISLKGHNKDRRRWCAQDEDAIAPGRTDARSARADEQGRFRFVDVAPGRYRLAARAPGRADSPAVEVELDTAGARMEVDVAFSAGADLVGRVVDERGTPLAGILVRIQADSVVNGVRTSTSVRSGEDGAFAARQLPLGCSYSVTVFPFDVQSADPCAPWLYSSLEAVDPAAGPVDFVLRRGVCIEGRVLDEFDRPRYGLQIALQNSHGEPGLGTSTDSDGRFRLGVEPDTTWTLTINGPKGDAAFTTLHVEPNVAAGTRDLILRLEL